MKALHCLKSSVPVAIVALLLSGALPVLAGAVNVAVDQPTPTRVTIHYAIDAPTLEGVLINGQKYAQVVLPGEGRLLQAGAPELPHVARSIILPDRGSPTISVLEARYEDVTGVDVAPSKGVIFRNQNPDDVPYTFGAVYGQDAFFPAAVAALGEPYILRDYRGVVVELDPCQYNPVTHTLRLYTELVVEVTTSGTGGVNVLDRSTRSGKIDSAFRQIYISHFINSEQAGLRYTPLDDTGDMLIIAYDAWISNVQPLADHKIAHGINTTIVGVSTIGNNATAIKNYIQNVYNSSDLSFVLLVGDAAQVATPTASGGSSDPTYSKLAGSDNYPDIIVGRFSAETAAQVDTQVLRTIEYENMPAALQDWFWKGTGIASAQGAGQGDEGQADYVHMDEIRQWLLDYGYTEVDQIYDTNGGTAADVTAALNEGRGIVNYCGHGDVTYWGTTGFSNNDVNALVNDNKLPFIISVACLNGQFDGATCFAEAWLRATHNGEPTGAIGAYMSSILQSWASPMEAQDEFNILLTELEPNTYFAFGAFCFAGSCSMMDAYGADGVDMFNTWHIFGDPSLCIRLTCTDAGTATLDRAKYACEDTVNVSVIDCGLNVDDLVIDTATVTIASNSEPAGETAVVTESGPATGQFNGAIQVSTTDAAGVLLVAPGDTLTLTYLDADNGQGQPVTVTATALVDCTPPAISNVHVADLQPRAATIAFDCDELARGTVHYGLSCGNLPWTAEGGFALSPTVTLTGLTDNVTYYYTVDATDEAGNTASDSTCRSFTTPEVPDFFTQLFTSDNDLDNLSLSFSPNNSNDFYLACAGAISELPTDPTGGTTLSLSDDSYVAVSLSGGATVSLYGVSYSSFYVGSNGYITFASGDSNYTESLDAHFNQPRVSGLFDDLNPAQGGTVSWKQLSDRAAITWLNVTEYGAGNQNTFQIELYFDGRITISYLAIAATDGLAGLSAGNGVDPDFLMSDLSALGPCQTFPPAAEDGAADVNENTPTDIPLSATDDGMPNPPGMLTYFINALPPHGTLTDPGTGAVINGVPYALAGGGNLVTYTPDAHYIGPDSFEFKANDGGTPPDGGDSNIATIALTVIGMPEVVYSFALDSDPGWTTTGAWAFGHPLGLGSHLKDPANGCTGSNVYGYNLAGDYANNLTPKYLTTTAIDCSEYTAVELRFWRWLGVEVSDHAGIELSTDGTTWAPVWSNLTTISEGAWTHQVYSLGAAADHQATVYIRWVMGPTDYAVTYPGWNLDDIEIWALAPAPGEVGDLNCDGTVDFGDINPFILALSNPIEYGIVYPSCDILHGDIDGDGSVDFGDINPFVQLLTSK
jgi:hypothetical protein